VGLAGIVGAGRTELARAIYGIDPIDSGEMRIGNTLIKKANPIKMIKLGVGLIPEDRKRYGIVPMSSVSENICHIVMDKLSKIGFISTKIREKPRRKKSRNST